MEGYIYPDDLEKHEIVCALSGFAGVIVFFSIQGILRKISIYYEQKQDQMSKLLFENLAYLVAIIFLCLLWRGVWNLNIRYMITDQKEGGAVNHVVGMLGLLLFNIYSIVGGCGCNRDGRDENGGAFFQIVFLREFFFPLVERIQKQNINHKVKL